MITPEKLGSIEEQGKYLQKVIKNPKFLHLEGAFQETPFFIYPYDPKRALEVARMKDDLLRNLKVFEPSVDVLEINIYDLAIEHLQELGVWEQLLEKETELEPEEFAELLRGMLDPGEDLAPKMAEKLAEHRGCEVVFLTGIGQVFPYIRAHTLLNNLSTVINKHPLLLFFPGFYRQSENVGSTLELFGQLKNDQYYRARNILEVEV